MVKWLIFHFAVLLSGKYLEAQPVVYNPSGGYYLVLSARPATLKPFSLGGHVFVSWGQGDSNIIRVQRSLGFYPNPNINLFTAIFRRKPGRIERGFRTNSRGVHLTQMILELDSAEWGQTMRSSESWDGVGYNLWDHNCTFYVEDIAKRASLKTPDRHSLFIFPRGPVKYVEKMWRKNRKRCKKPAQLYFEEPGTDVDTVILGPDDYILLGMPRQHLIDMQEENRVRVEAGFFDINFARTFEHLQ